MKTKEQIELDLYHVNQRQSINNIEVNPNKIFKIQEGLEGSGQKIPDPKLHQIISFYKSGIRLVACFIGILGFYELGFFGLFTAEIVGIYEELV